MAKKPTIIWNNIEIIGAVEKTNRSMLQVELVARRGVKYVNVREWFQRSGGGVWRPNGMAGFTIPVLMPINGVVEPAAQQLVDLLNEAIEKAPDFAMDNPEKTVWGIRK